MSAILSFLAARLKEPTTQSNLGIGIAGFLGALVSGLGLGPALLALAVAAVSALCPEAKPVLDALAPEPPAPTPPPTAISPTSGPVVILLACLAAASVLSACNADLTLTPGATKALTIACAVDGALQPILVPLVPVEVATIDQALVHPAVVAACATLGGVPASVQAVK